MQLRLAVVNFLFIFTTYVNSQFNDICGVNNGKRFYLEHGESASLVADYKNNIWHEQNKNISSSNKCTLEFVTCPSCIVSFKFR